MSDQHKNCAQGQWGKLSLLEQMANVGSEVERALNWRVKNNAAYSERAAERALELMDLTLDGAHEVTHFKELARTREAIADYFFGSNQFLSTEAAWRKYFLSFAYAARRNH